jgi:undecaprenyl-diphosphatase
MKHSEQLIASSSELPATRYALFAALLLSCAALVGVCYGLLQLDVPLARFLRSVQVAWLDAANRVGNRLGSGIVLVAISGSLFLVGVARGSLTLRRAGWQGLLAHAVAGLTVQVLKHLIGRPRPRFLHAGGFQLGPLWGPSLETGLDSFPSGHSAATFAVAVVVARQFPSVAKLCYVAAGFVAVTRFLSGSHFPTDVLAGMGIGLLAGHLVSRPVRDWRLSVGQAMKAAAIPAVVIFAVLWTMMQHPSGDWLELGLIGLGLFLLIAGILSRIWHALHPPPHPSPRTLHRSRLLVATGLALTTGSLIIGALAALVTMAAGLLPPGGPREPGPLSRELVYSAGLIVMVMLIQSLRGVLPLS